MTPEQVSALSDDELNTAMFHLYWVVDAKDEFDKLFNSISPESLKYLTDYNLTMPLVAEKGVTVSNIGAHFMITHYLEIEGVGECSYNVSNKNYLRAACECLVLIALDKKKV